MDLCLIFKSAIGFLSNHCSTLQWGFEYHTNLVFKWFNVEKYNVIHCKEYITINSILFTAILYMIYNIILLLSCCRIVFHPLMVSILDRFGGHTFLHSNTNPLLAIYWMFPVLQSPLYVLTKSKPFIGFWYFFASIRSKTWFVFVRFIVFSN